MKKLNGKLVVCALLAASMMSMTAVSSGAIDYGDGAEPPTVTLEEPTVLTENDVSDAISTAAESGASQVVIEMEADSSGSVTVQESAISEIANGDVVVTVAVESSAGMNYSVTIDPALVTEAKAINLAMDITVGAEQGTTTTSGVEVPQGAIVIAPAQKGDFGMTLQIELPAEAVSGIEDINAAELYYIDDDGNIELVPNGLVINADGSVTISISHASEYVISDVKLIDTESDVQAGSDDNNSLGKNDGEDAVIDVSSESDNNPGTGVTLAFGVIAASAAAVALTAKKRK